MSHLADGESTPGHWVQVCKDSGQRVCRVWEPPHLSRGCWLEQYAAAEGSTGGRYCWSYPCALCRVNSVISWCLAVRLKYKWFVGRTGEGVGTRRARRRVNQDTWRPSVGRGLSRIFVNVRGLCIRVLKLFIFRITEEMRGILQLGSWGLSCLIFSPKIHDKRKKCNK